MNSKRHFSTSSKASGAKRLTKIERAMYNIEGDIKDVLVGSSLGDLYMRRSSPTANARAVFRQGEIHSEFLYHLYDLFKIFTLSPPKFTTIVDKKTGKSRRNLSFATLNLPCFNEIYELFYVNGIKVVPQNIGELLSPIAFAYWIMDDGAFTGSGLRLSTDAFTKPELNLLIDALKTNFNIIATINIHDREKEQYTLYISKHQLPLVISIVGEHMLDSFMYKLGK